MVNVVQVKGSQFRFKTDKKFLTQALRKEGTAIARDARQMIRNSTGGGTLYNSHVSSAPNNPPASLTGLLARSIRVRNRRINKGLSIAVRDVAPYALALEAGSKGGGPGGKRVGTHKKGQYKSVGKRVQEPRPFLSIALENAIKGGLQKRLGDALARDL